MSDTAQILVAAFTALGLVGSGAIAAWVKARRSKAEGVENDDVIAQPSRADPSPMVGFAALTGHLQDEIKRLQRAHARAVKHGAQLEEQIGVERDLKWKAIQLARQLYLWIAHRLPGETPPPVPASLAPYIMTTKEKDDD